MNIQLSEHFTYRKLLRFVLPSIVMMIFTSIYSVVDGLFVSNFVGKSAFAAINLMMPFLMGISALGFMIGTGGSALVAKTLGEGKKEKANEYFSMLVYITLAGGLIIAILSAFAMRPVAIILGARGELLKNCVLYGRILCISLTCFMLQNVFQSFFVAAEKPHLGLRVVVIAGVTNMLLEFSVRSRVALGTCRCRDCYCLWRIDRRYLSDFLLWAQKFQPAEAWKNTFYPKFIKGLYQWFFRAYD